MASVNVLHGSVAFSSTSYGLFRHSAQKYLKILSSFAKEIAEKTIHEIIHLFFFLNRQIITTIILFFLFYLLSTGSVG